MFLAKMRPQRRGYVIAFLTTAIALVLTWLLQPLILPSFFALFYPAVMISALEGGLGPGLFSVTLAGLASKYLFLDPVYSLSFDSPITFFRLTLLVLVGVMICLVSTALRTAKQRAEVSLLKLQSSEAMYRRIVETANEGIWLIDAQFRTAYVNAQMARMLGYTVEEMLGRSCLEFIYEADRIEAMRRFEQRRQGIAEQSEFCFRRQDGSPVWVQSNSSPILNDNGECVSVLGMMTDITERKRSEQRQRVQYAIARVLAEATTLADAVPTILQSLCESLGWQVGMIWSVDRLANVVCYVESWHAPTVNVEEFTVANQQMTFPSGIGVPGRIWANGQPTWIANLINDDNFPRGAIAAKAGLRGALGFPIRLENEILGVIECFSNKIQEPDQDLLQMMDSIGGQIGQFMERKRAEEALAQSQQLFESFMNNIPGTAFIKDEQGRYLYTNPVGERLVKRKLVDIVGKTDFDIVPVAVAQQLRDNDISVLAANHPIEMLETIPQEDGEHYWISFKFPFKDTSGKQILAGMSFDITERKQLEEALRESEQRYRLLAEALPQFVWTAQANAQTDYCNQYWYNYTGLTEEQTLGDGWITALHPDDQQRTRARWQKAMETGERYEIEYRFRRAIDGQYRWHLASVGPIYNSSGQIIKWVGTAIDISDRQQAEEALRASETLYRTLSEAVPDFIWSCNNETQVDFVNSRWLEYTGMTSEELNTGGLEQVSHPDDFPQLLERWNLARHNRQLFEAECRYRRKDGVYRWFMVRAVPLKDANGNIVKWIGTTTDIHERKQTEEALRQSEERLRVALKNSPVSVFNQDRELRYTWKYNPAFGYTVEAVIGKRDRDLLSPDDAAVLTRIKRQVLETGIGARQEVKITKQGKDWYYDLTVEPLRDANHEVIGVTCAAVDISEHKQSEMALQKSETLLNALLASSPIGQAFLDRDLRYIHANEALAAINGLPLSEHLGRTLWDVLPEWAPQAAPIIQRVMQTQEPLLNREISGETYPPGVYRHCLVSYYPVCLPDGQVLGVGVNSVDVTELKRVEQALRESEGRLSLAMEAAHLGFWDWNILKGNVTWSYHYARLLGFVPEEFQGSYEAFLACIHPEDRELVSQAGTRSLENGTYEAEFRVIWADGSIHWITAKGQVFHDQTGRAIRMIGVIRDSTVQKQAKIQSQQLLEREQAARAEAEAANRIKDEFLAVLSHELRSPLNPILGWTKLLRSRKFDEKATDQALETIERNAKLQTQLIEDLLDVSRILRGKMVLNISPVNLATTIDAALETVRLAVDAKGIQIQTVFDANVGRVWGDANRLQQVVWNLLSNAVKFTPSGGRVEVRLSVIRNQGSVATNNEPQTTDQYAQIQVKDNGKGIAREFLPYVFEYFRQENGSTTRKFGGLGLGLAIVRHLVELHGGSVFAESPGEGLGATFTVRLPLMEAHSEVAQEEVSSNHSPDLNGLQILVVDDQADIRELVALILEQSGAEVTVAASASEALVALNQSVPDILLSDIGMPEMDGYMLMRKIRALSIQQGGQIPAIALTAYAGEYNQQQALAAGFQLHISKPVEPEDLVKAIARLVGRMSNV